MIDGMGSTIPYGLSKTELAVGVGYLICDSWLSSNLRTISILYGKTYNGEVSNE